MTLNESSIIGDDQDYIKLHYVEKSDRVLLRSVLIKKYGFGNVREENNTDLLPLTEYMIPKKLILK